MVRNRLVRVAVSLLALTYLSTPSRANNLGVVEEVSDLPYRSAYLNWMAQTELSGLAAPVAITNQPCFVYNGPHLLVLPCPGTVTYASTVIDSDPFVTRAPGCGYRYRVHYRGCISRRY